MDYSNKMEIIKETYQQYGPRRFLKAGINFIFFGFPFYIKRKLDKRNSFIFNNEEYNYYLGFYNKTWMNERCVEISLAMKILETFKDKKILEVGNVLSYYIDVPHDIVDKYERKVGVINEDIINFNPNLKYDLIISISTIEHIGYDEEHKDKEKIPNVIENLKNLLKPGGLLFITVPLGHNPSLDCMIKENRLNLKQFYLKRISKGNKWIQVDLNSVRDSRYGHPFNAANVIMIGMYQK